MFDELRQCSARFAQATKPIKAIIVAGLLIGGLWTTWRMFFASVVWTHQPLTWNETIESCLPVGCFPSDIKKCKAIIRVDGRLAIYDWLIVTFYSVDEGTVREVGGINAALPTRPGAGPLARRFDVDFALCECEHNGTPAVVLGMRRRLRGAGSGSFLAAPRRATNIRFFAGRVSRLRPTILYVEGDTSVAQPGMTIAEFAERNSDGSYIVVTMQITSGF